ncbi:MAG: hypothetical protein R3Y62_01170 [Eubacteriales bacterium]
MDIIIATLIGLTFGGLQFFLLFRGVRSVAKGNMNALYFIAQFFCPFLGLGLCVWLAKSQLILAASIICGILFLGAIGYMIDTRKKV